MSGVKMTYQGNVLYCALHREIVDNIEVCKQALALLEGLDEEVLFVPETPFKRSLFEENGGRIEICRMTG